MFYLKIKFENAGVFRKNWKDNGESRDKGDRVYNNSVNKSGKKISVSGESAIRSKDKHMDVENGTLHYSTVQNILKVMSGIRPLSRYRNTCVNDSGEFLEASKKSLVKIDSLSLLNSKTEKKQYLTETQQVSKCIPNCWNPAAIITWDKIKASVGNVEFNMFIEQANNVLGINCLENKVMDVFDKLRNTNSELIGRIQQGVSAFNNLARSEKDGVARFGMFSGKKDNPEFVKNITLVNKGISAISRLDGEIFIPLSESEIELIKSGPGVATTYDGGVALIFSVIPDMYMTKAMLSGFKEVMQND